MVAFGAELFALGFVKSTWDDKNEFLDGKGTIGALANAAKRRRESE